MSATNCSRQSSSCNIRTCRNNATPKIDNEVPPSHHQPSQNFLTTCTPTGSPPTPVVHRFVCKTDMQCSSKQYTTNLLAHAQQICTVCTHTTSHICRCYLVEHTGSLIITSMHAAAVALAAHAAHAAILPFSDSPGSGRLLLLQLLVVYPCWCRSSQLRLPAGHHQHRPDLNGFTTASYTRNSSIVIIRHC
jgi:hypothetical protein